MIVPKNIVHIRQGNQNNCAAIAVAMLLGRSVSECEKICQTTAKGTYDYNVSNGLRLLNVPHFYVDLSVDFMEHLEYLRYLSYKFPLYVSGKYKHQNIHGRGCDCVRYHAAAIIDGIVYDSARQEAFPVDAYAHVFSRSLTITTIIVIDEERPNFLKNFVD